MVEGACLENRCTATYRGFESLTHRNAVRSGLAAPDGAAVLYPPAPPGEKGKVPLPLLRSYPLCRPSASKQYTSRLTSLRPFGPQNSPAETSHLRWRFAFRSGLAAPDGAAVLYPPVPPGEKGKIPLPLLRSYLLCRPSASKQYTSCLTAPQPFGPQNSPAATSHLRWRFALSEGFHPLYPAAPRVSSRVQGMDP